MVVACCTACGRAACVGVAWWQFGQSKWVLRGSSSKVAVVFSQGRLVDCTGERHSFTRACCQKKKIPRNINAMENGTQIHHWNLLPSYRLQPRTVPAQLASAHSKKCCSRTPYDSSPREGWLRVAVDEAVGFRR